MTKEYPKIPDLPEAPIRNQPEIDYANTASVFVGALSPWGDAVNVAGDWIQDQIESISDIREQVDVVQTLVDEAQDSARAAQTSAEVAHGHEQAAKKHLDDTIDAIQTFDPTGAMPPSTVEGAPLVVATEQGGVRFADDPLTDVAFTSNAGLYDSFFSPPVIVADSYTAKHRDTVIINTTDGEVTVTLPADPEVNERVRFVDYSGGWSKKNAIVDRNGQRIAGVMENLILNVKGGNPTLIYTGSTYGWAIA